MAWRSNYDTWQRDQAPTAEELSRIAHLFLESIGENTMAIRCKFHLLSVTRTLMQSYDSVTQKSALKEGDTFKFHVVSGGADATQEDKDFFMSTPNGNLEFSSVNPTASAALKLGKKYYVEITEAPE